MSAGMDQAQPKRIWVTTMGMLRLAVEVTRFDRVRNEYIRASL